MNSLLPDKNFFAFKYFTKKRDTDKMKEEIEELGKINKLAEIHGNYRIEK